MKRILLLLVGVALLASAKTTRVQLAEEQDVVREEFHQSYPLAANGRVSLSNIAGEIHVVGWDRNEVKIDAVKKAYRQERLAEARIEVEASSDLVRIKTKYPERSGNFYIGPGGGRDRGESAAWVEYMLNVPRGATLADIQSVSGKVILVGVTGDMKAASVSGDVKAEKLASQSARLSSVSGEVNATLERTAEGQQIDLSSVSGEVALTLASDANASVKASSVSGSVRNTFGLPVRVGQYVGRDFAGQIGNGGARIKLNTVSGSVELRRANDGKNLNNVSNLLNIDNERAVISAEAQREYQEAIREAEKAQSEAEKEYRQAQQNYEKARRDYEKNSQNANDDARREAQRQLEEAQRNFDEARREFQQSQREFRNAQRDAQRENERANREVQRELARAQAEAVREAARAQAEAARAQAEAARGLADFSRGDWGPSLTARDERTLDVKGTPTLNLHTDDGPVAVHGWDGQQVKVVFVKRGREQADLDNFTLKAEANGANVEIRAEVNKKKLDDKGKGWYFNGSVGLEVWLPRQVRKLMIHTGDGRILLEGVSGELDLKTGDGGVDVLRSAGHLKVVTGDGRINVSDFKGGAWVKTGDGRIALSGAFTDLDARTGDGTINFSYAEGLNAVVEAECEAVVTNGSFSRVSDSDKVKRLTIGDGGKVFRFKTGDGRVYVQKAN
jgi:DUF4097 and DUF4098 domain-containing protein YvlB